MRGFGLQASGLGRWAGAACAATLTLLVTVGCRTTAPPTATPPPPEPEAVSPGESVEPGPAPSVSEALPPRTERPVPKAPETIRVGLQTDRDSVSFGCCELHATWRGATYAVTHPLLVEPAAAGTREAVFRLQIAALRDEDEARALADRLTSLTGREAVVRFDAESGLYRVRLGTFEARDWAAKARADLRAHGVAEAWVVSEGGGVVDPALRVTQGEAIRRLPGRWLEISNPEGSAVSFEGRLYRGRILLYLNDRGTINVVNELSLEDYLRGVVPRELGPDAFPELEALKAQAVAARTYAVRTLGEFHEEGFDICATPRCQVFGGMAAEHPLSDRAVRETVGEVLLWKGEPIDALYSSTCGGHTEDVGIVFPLRTAPYLRGVPCVESGITRLEGSSFPQVSLAEAVAERLVPSRGRGPGGFADRLQRLARLAGLSPPPRLELEDLSASAVRRAVAASFDLVLDARFFVADAELPYLVVDPPTSWTEQDRRLAAFFVTVGLDSGGEGTLDRVDRAELLFRLAERLGVVEVEEVRFDGLRGATILVARDEEGERTSHELAAGFATFRRLEPGDEQARPGTATLVPGDELELFVVGGRIVALLQQVHRGGTDFDRSSPWRSWRRFRSHEEIAENVRERFPGFTYRDLEIGPRGVSGRVASISLLGEGGERRRVEGLPVRWLLELPDTRFTARRVDPPRGPAGWLFHGSGWGHGVGVCQVGAYGMAVRGHDYRDILHHYYTGVELGTLGAAGEPLPER